MKKFFLLLLAALGFSAYSMAQNAFQITVPAAGVEDMKFSAENLYNMFRTANLSEYTGGGTIQLLADIDTTSESWVTFPSITNNKVTLDLNGYTLKVVPVNDVIPFYVEGGVFEITDTSEAGTGKLVSASTNSAIQIVEGGELIFTKGTLQAGVEEASRGVTINTTGGTLTMNGGSITGFEYGVDNAGGTVTLKNAMIEATQYGVCNTGTATIEDSTIVVPDTTGILWSAIKSQSGTVSVLSGTIDGGLSTSGSGTIEISGGTFSADPTAYLVSGYETTQDETTGLWGITDKTEAPNPVYVAEVNGVGVEAGRISTAIASSSNTSYASVKLLMDVDEEITAGGEMMLALDLNGFTISKTVTYTGTHSNGLTISYSEAGGSITAEPAIVCGGVVKIQGGTYTGSLQGATVGTTVINGGAFSFDPTDYLATGTVAVEAIAGQWVVIPSDEIAVYIRDGKPVLQSPYFYKTTMSAVLSNARSGDTIKLVKDVTESSGIIEFNKNCVLDLNGHTLKNTFTGTSIYNVGTLEITDTSETGTGTIVSTAGTYAVQNAASGTLIITKAIITRETASRSAYAIDNYGNLLIEDCTVASGMFGYAVNNTGSAADTTINGGALEGSTYALRATAGMMNVTGGTVTGALTGSGLKISGGSFTKDPTSYLAEGYWTRTTSNPWVVTKAPAATVNGVAYETLAAAVAAASDGQTIVLTKSSDETLTLDTSKAITLDLNGQTLTGATVVAGSLAIADAVGDGSIGDVSATEPGSATISGFFTTVTGTVSGAVVITGGQFTNDPTGSLATDYTAKLDATSGKWIVYASDGYPAGAAVVLTYTESGELFGCYASFMDALDAIDQNSAAATTTMTLFEDVTLTSTLQLNPASYYYTTYYRAPGVLDLNGYTIDMKENIFGILNLNAPMTIKNGTITGNGPAGGGVIQVSATQKLTFEGVTVQNTGKWGYAIKLRVANVEAVNSKFLIAHTEDTTGSVGPYVIAITPDNTKGTTVVLNNCEIQNANNGVALAYLAAPSTTTIMGDNTKVVGAVGWATDVAFDLSISGGQYVGVNPTNYLVDGYAVVFGSGTVEAPYVVGEAIPPVAKIGDTTYETLEAALAAAKSGDTVFLLADTKGAVMVPEGVTIAPSATGTMHNGSFNGPQYAILGEGRLVVSGMDSKIDSNNLTLGTKVVLDASAIAVSNVTFYGPLPENNIVPVTAPTFTATGIMSYTENGKTACEVTALTAVSGGTQLTLASVETTADGAVTIEMKLDENLKPETVKDEDGNKVPVMVPVLDVEKGLDLATPEIPSASTTTVTELKTPDATTTVATVTTTTDAEGNVTQTKLEVKEPTLVLDGVDVEIVTKTAADTPVTMEADNEAMVILDAAYDVETATAETPKLSYVYDFGIVDVAYTGSNLTSVTAHLTEGVDAEPRSDTLSNAVLEVVREQGDKETVIGELSSPTFTEGDCVVPLENVSLGDGLSNIKVRLRQK